MKVVISKRMSEGGRKKQKRTEKKRKKHRKKVADDITKITQADEVETPKSSLSPTPPSPIQKASPTPAHGESINAKNFEGTKKAVFRGPGISGAIAQFDDKFKNQDASVRYKALETIRRARLSSKISATDLENIIKSSGGKLGNLESKLADHVKQKQTQGTSKGPPKTSVKITEKT